MTTTTTTPFTTCIHCNAPLIGTDDGVLASCLDCKSEAELLRGDLYAYQRNEINLRQEERCRSYGWDIDTFIARVKLARKQ